MFRILQQNDQGKLHSSVYANLLTKRIHILQLISKCLIEGRQSLPNSTEVRRGHTKPNQTMIIKYLQYDKIQVDIRFQLLEANQDTPLEWMWPYHHALQYEHDWGNLHIMLSIKGYSITQSTDNSSNNPYQK